MKSLGRPRGVSDYAYRTAMKVIRGVGGHSRSFCTHHKVRQLLVGKPEFIRPRPYDPMGEGGRDGLGPTGWMGERSLRPIQSGGLGSDMKQVSKCPQTKLSRCELSTHFSGINCQFMRMWVKKVTKMYTFVTNCYCFLNFPLQYGLYSQAVYDLLWIY